MTFVIRVKYFHADERLIIDFENKMSSKIGCQMKKNYSALWHACLRSHRFFWTNMIMGAAVQGVQALEAREGRVLVAPVHGESLLLSAAQMVPWVCNAPVSPRLPGGKDRSELAGSVFWKQNMAHQPSSGCWGCRLLQASELVLIEEYGTGQLVTQLRWGGDVKLNATLGRQNFSPSFKQRTWQISRNELLRDRKCWRMSPSPPSSPRRRPRQPK